MNPEILESNGHEIRVIRFPGDVIYYQVRDVVVFAHPEFNDNVDRAGHFNVHRESRAQTLGISDIEYEEIRRFCQAHHNMTS